MSASLDPKELNELIVGSKIIFSSMKGKKKAVKEEKKHSVCFCLNSFN